MRPATNTVSPQPATELAKSAPKGPPATSRSFAELGAGPQPVRLVTPQAAYVLKLPLSPREILQGAVLTLSTVNSTALIKSRSEMSVRVNGQMLGQFALDPEKTSAKRDIELPPQFLKSGYNDVTVSVVQHYSYECEDPLSPELWTEINPLQSFITMGVVGVKPNLNPKLSQLHIAFDQRAWTSRKLSVVSGTERISEPQLAAAALVVQGLALRTKSRPLEVSVYGAATGAAISPEPTSFPGLSSVVVKDHDVLLVGRHAELSRYLSPEIYQQTAGGPKVAIYPAMEGESVILVVTGETDEELMQAARSLAQPEYVFSDVSVQTIEKKWAFEPAYTARPDEKEQFNSFGFRTSENRGLQIQANHINFRAPADYGASPGEYLTVHLHFSYGAGLREDSALMVKLNGQFATSVPLSSRVGAELTNYIIKVPAEHVRPGLNDLVLQPVFQPVRDRCEQIREESLVLTVYEDSSLELPSPSVAPVAPDLVRLSQSLWPMQEKLRLYLTQQDQQTATATLRFVAMLAQLNRSPFEVEVRYAPYEEGNMMVIGPTSGLAQFVRDALPLQQYAWTAVGSQAGVLQAVEGKRVITAFVANDSAVLERAVYSLGSKGLWNSLAGEASIIDAAEQTVVSHPARKVVAFGRTNRIAQRIALSDWRDLAIWAGGLSLIFAFAFIAVLRKHAESRQKLKDPGV